MEQDRVNRRRFLRVKFPFTVHVHPPSEAPISAYSEDISEGGIKVTIHKSLEISSIVGLLIYVQRDPVRCEGKVVWVKEHPSNYIDDIDEGPFFDIGMEFEDISDKDILVIRERVEALEKQRQLEAKQSETLI